MLELKKRLPRKVSSHAAPRQEPVRNDLSVVAEPTDFFRGLVTGALQSQKIRAGQNTEFYLVDLLSRFMFTENLFAVGEDGSRREEVLALLLRQALAAQDVSRRHFGLRRLGDVSLYTAGFFSQRLSRKVVDVDYYIGMGRTAYDNLARMRLDAIFSEAYAELAASFHKFVDVLAEISETSVGADAKNLLRTYELWLKTRSERAEKSLKEAGIIPNKLVKPSWQ